MKQKKLLKIITSLFVLSFLIQNFFGVLTAQAVSTIPTLSEEGSTISWDNANSSAYFPLVIDDNAANGSVYGVFFKAKYYEDEAQQIPYSGDMSNWHVTVDLGVGIDAEKHPDPVNFNNDPLVKEGTSIVKETANGWGAGTTLGELKFRILGNDWEANNVYVDLDMEIVYAESLSQNAPVYQKHNQNVQIVIMEGELGENIGLDITEISVNGISGNIINGEILGVDRLQINDGDEIILTEGETLTEINNFVLGNAADVQDLRRIKFVLYSSSDINITEDFYIPVGMFCGETITPGYTCEDMYRTVEAVPNYNYLVLDNNWSDLGGAQMLRLLNLNLHRAIDFETGAVAPYFVPDAVEDLNFEGNPPLEGSLHLAWDSVPGADSYIVYRKAYDGVPTSFNNLLVDVAYAEGDYEPVDGGTTTLTSFEDNTMTESGEYQYAIKASYNGEQSEDYSNSVHMFVTAVAGVPAPTDLLASDFNPTSIKLAWTGHESVNSYTVEKKRTDEPETEWVPSSNTISKTNHKVTSLSPETEYDFRVQSNGDPSSAWVTITGIATTEDLLPVAGNDFRRTIRDLTIPIESLTKGLSTDGYYGGDIDVDGGSIGFLSLVRNESTMGVSVYVDGPNVVYNYTGGFDETIDTFQYNLKDDEGNTVVATVSVDVYGIRENRRPETTTSLSLDTFADSVTVSLLNGVTDPDLDHLKIASIEKSLTVNGSTFIINEDRQTAEYTHGPGFTGSEIFRYQIVDGFGGVLMRQVTINVTEGGGGTPPEIEAFLNISPKAPGVGEEVVFDGSSSHGVIKSFGIDVDGDGKNECSSEVTDPKDITCTAIYDEPGNYNSLLEVVDVDNNKSTATEKVVVSDK